MEKTDYVIDIQAFHDKEGLFLPKEVAILGIDCNVLSHWITKPPYPSAVLSRGILSTNSYLTCYHHGIEWFDGESNIKDVCKTLQNVARNAVRIYVRGAVKAEFLEKLLSRRIINLETYSCPSFKNLPQVDDHFCFFHGQKKESLSCAVSYVYKLRLWLIKTVYGGLPTKKTVKTTQSSKPTNIKSSSVASLDTTLTSVTTSISKCVLSDDDEIESENSYHYYDSVDVNDEHSSNSTSDRTVTSSHGRRLSSRQDSPGVDETDCDCC